MDSNTHSKCPSLELFASSWKQRPKHSGSLYSRTGSILVMLWCLLVLQLLPPTCILSRLVWFSWLSSSRSAVWWMRTSSRQTSIWEETSLHSALGSLAHLQINQYWRQLRLASGERPRGFREACVFECSAYAALSLLIYRLLGNADTNINKAAKLNFPLWYCTECVTCKINVYKSLTLFSRCLSGVITFYRFKIMHWQDFLFFLTSRVVRILVQCCMETYFALRIL